MWPAPTRRQYAHRLNRPRRGGTEIRYSAEASRCCSLCTPLQQEWRRGRSRRQSRHRHRCRKLFCKESVTCRGRRFQADGRRHTAVQAPAAVPVQSAPLRIQSAEAPAVPAPLPVPPPLRFQCRMMRRLQSQSGRQYDFLNPRHPPQSVRKVQRLICAGARSRAQYHRPEAGSPPPRSGRGT